MSIAPETALQAVDELADGSGKARIARRPGVVDADTGLQLAAADAAFGPRTARNQPIDPLSRIEHPLVNGPAQQPVDRDEGLQQRLGFALPPREGTEQSPLLPHLRRVRPGRLHVNGPVADAR